MISRSSATLRNLNQYYGPKILWNGKDLSPPWLLFDSFLGDCTFLGDSLWKSFNLSAIGSSDISSGNCVSSCIHCSLTGSKREIEIFLKNSENKMKFLFRALLIAEIKILIVNFSFKISNSIHRSFCWESISRNYLSSRSIISNHFSLPNHYS